MQNLPKVHAFTKIKPKLCNNDAIIKWLVKHIFENYLWKFLVGFISLFGKKLDGVDKFTYSRWIRLLNLHGPWIVVKTRKQCSVRLSDIQTYAQHLRKLQKNIQTKLGLKTSRKSVLSPKHPGGCEPDYCKSQQYIQFTTRTIGSTFPQVSEKWNEWIKT